MAAEQGLPYAKYSLGYLYEEGLGVAQDYQQARYWYAKAVVQGDDLAREALKRLDAIELEGATNNTERQASSEQTAGQEAHDAFFELGWIYYNGREIGSDHKAAERWFRKAAEQNDPNAQYQLGCIYLNGKDIGQDYQQAEQWFRMAAEQGHRYAQCQLGGMYYKGAGIEQDYEEAVRWFRRAAEQGHRYAQCQLGGMYYKGAGIEAGGAVG